MNKGDQTRWTRGEMGFITLPLLLAAALLACCFRLNPLSAWLGVAAALNAVLLYFALFSSLPTPRIRFLLRFEAVCVLFLWFMALPSAGQWEVFSLRPGMTRAQVNRALRRYVPQNYRPEREATTDPCYYRLKDSRGLYDGVVVRFDADGTLTEITPAFD